jgi:DNA-binding GntR family transcriptional regulator
LSTRYHFLSLADASRMTRSAVYMDDFLAACERRNGTRAATIMRESIEWTLDYLTEWRADQT